MIYEELIDVILAKRTKICFVGAGGKSSLIASLARICSLRGKRVLITTTTHIVKPDRYYANTCEEVLGLWKEGKYAVIGTETLDNKLTAPEDSIYIPMSELADLILIEADGAKMLPCKIPEGHEPVIEEDCDIVIGLMGITAIGKPLKEICFRFESAGEWLEVSGDTILSPEIAAKILCHEKGTRKNVKDKKYIVVLNQCDDDILLGHAREIEKYISEGYDFPVMNISLRKILRNNDERNL